MDRHDLGLLVAVALVFALMAVGVFVKGRVPAHVNNNIVYGIMSMSAVALILGGMWFSGGFLAVAVVWYVYRDYKASKRAR